jgi:hypothetical protein
MLGAQSAYAFIENNGRGKLNFSSCGKITANPDIMSRTGVLSGLASTRELKDAEVLPALSKRSWFFVHVAKT